MCVLQQSLTRSCLQSGESWCERSQKARKAGRANTVKANSGLLFKQMFMNIFCHICRVLIVIWLDGHMSLKVEDWIYRGRNELGGDLLSWVLESESSPLILHKLPRVSPCHLTSHLGYCSFPSLRQWDPAGKRHLCPEQDCWITYSFITVAFFTFQSWQT